MGTRRGHAVASDVAYSGDVPGALHLVEQAMTSPIDPVETGFVAAQVAGSLARVSAAVADFQWIAKLPDPRERGLAYASAAFGLTDHKKHDDE